MATPTSAVRAALRLDDGAARLAIPHDSERCRALLLRLLREVVAFVRQQEQRQPPAKSLLWIHAVARVCESRIEQLTRSDDVATSWTAAPPRSVVAEAMVRELLVSLASIRLAETEAMVLDEVENVETLRHLQLTLQHEEATLRRVVRDGAGEDAQLRELQILLREDFLQELAQTRAKTLAESMHNEASLQFAWETIQEQKKEIMRLRVENEQLKASGMSNEPASRATTGSRHEEREAEPALAIHELQRQLAAHPNGNIRALEDQVARLELEMARQNDLHRSVSGVTLDSSREDGEEGRRGSMLLPSHLTTSAYRRECDQCRLQARKLVECQSEVKQLRVQAVADQGALVSAEKERVQMHQENSTLTQALLTAKQTQEELRRMITEVSSEKLKLQTLYETTEMNRTRQAEELRSQVSGLSVECDRLNRELAEYQQANERLTSDVDSIRAAYTRVEVELKTVLSQLQEVCTAKEEVQSRLKEEQRHAKEYEKSLVAMEREMESYRRQLNDMAITTQRQEEVELELRTALTEGQIASEALHRKVLMLEEGCSHQRKEQEELLALNVELQDQLHVKDAAISERDNTINHLSRNRQHEKMAAQGLHDQLRECQRQLQQATRRIAELEGRADLSEEQRSTLSVEIDALLRRVEEQEDQRRALENELREQYEEIGRLELVLADEQGANSRMQQQLMNYGEERVRYDEDLRIKQKTSASASEKVEKLSHELTETKTTILMWMSKYHAVVDDKDKLQVANEALASRTAEAASELNRTELALAESIRHVKELQASSEALQHECGQLQDRNLHLESVVSDLSQMKHDWEESARSTLNKHAEEMAKMENALSNAADDGKSAGVKLEASEKELERAQNETASLRALIDDLNCQVQDREACIAEQDYVIEQQTIELQEREELVEQLIKELDARKEEIRSCLNRCEDLQCLLVQSAEHAEAAKAEINRLRNELEDSTRQAQLLIIQSPDSEPEQSDGSAIERSTPEEVSGLRNEMAMLTEELEQTRAAYQRLETRLSEAMTESRQLEIRLASREGFEEKQRDGLRNLLTEFEGDCNSVWMIIGTRLADAESRLGLASKRLRTTTTALARLTRLTETPLMLHTTTQTTQACLDPLIPASTQTDDAVKVDREIYGVEISEPSDHVYSSTEQNPLHNAGIDYPPDFEISSDMASAESTENLDRGVEVAPLMDDNHRIEKPPTAENARSSLIQRITAFDHSCWVDLQRMECTLAALDRRLGRAVEKVGGVSSRRLKSVVSEYLKYSPVGITTSADRIADTPLSHCESAWVQTEPTGILPPGLKVDGVRGANHTDATTYFTKAKRSIRLKTRPKPAIVLVQATTKIPSHEAKGVQTTGNDSNDAKADLVATRWSMLVRRLLEKSCRFGVMQLFRAHVRSGSAELKVANRLAGLALRLLALSRRRYILRTAVATASHLRSCHLKDAQSFGVARRWGCFARILMEVDRRKNQRTNLTSVAEQLQSKIHSVRVTERNQRAQDAVTHTWQFFRWRLLSHEHLSARRRYLVASLKLVRQAKLSRREVALSPTPHVAASNDPTTTLNEAVPECVVLLRKCCVEQTEITRRIERQQSLLADGSVSSGHTSSGSVDMQFLIQLLLECSEQLVHWKDAIDIKLQAISVREGQLNRLEMHCTELQVLVDKYEKRYAETERRGIESKALAKLERERRQLNDRNVHILEGVIVQLQEAKQVRAQLHERLERRTQSLHRAELCCQALKREHFVFRAFYQWRVFTLSKGSTG